jgi:hypothetical protein
LTNESRDESMNELMNELRGGSMMSGLMSDGSTREAAMGGLTTTWSAWSAPVAVESTLYYNLNQNLQCQTRELWELRGRSRR